MAKEEVKNKTKRTKADEIKKESKKPSTVKKINKEKKKEASKDKLSYKIMVGVFVFLLVVVLVLTGLVIRQHEIHKNDINPDLVIPIMREGVKEILNIDLKELSSDKGQYILKLTNYRGNNISEIDIKPVVAIVNPTDIKIRVSTTKEGENNLMVNQKTTIIEPETFPAGESSELYYFITIEPGQKPKKGDLIGIQITS